jgi:DNA-binding GntR family transcriptional regulator
VILGPETISRMGVAAFSAQSSPPRTALSEATISKLIDVSRTPVREALAQVAEEQLVVIYRQVGTLVAPVRLSLLEEGRFVRSTLECASHVQLAQTITPEQLADFWQALEAVVVQP